MHDEPTRPTEDDLISWSEHDAHTDGARKQPPGPIQPADPTRNGDGPACTSPSPAGLDPVSADAATRPGPGDSHAASVVCFLRAVLAQQIERPAGRMPGSALDELPIAEAAGAVLRFGDLTGLVASVGDLHQRTVRLEQERGRYQLAWCSARTRARGIAGPQQCPPSALGLLASTEPTVMRFLILPAAYLVALGVGIATVLVISAFTGWQLDALALLAGAAGGLIGLNLLMVELWLRTRDAQRRELGR